MTMTEGDPDYAARAELTRKVINALGIATRRYQLGQISTETYRAALQNTWDIACGLLMDDGIMQSVAAVLNDLPAAEVLQTRMFIRQGAVVIVRWQAGTERVTTMIKSAGQGDFTCRDTQNDDPEKAKAMFGSVCERLLAQGYTEI